MQLRFLIAIPVYNHDTTILKVIEEALERTTFPILIIDDGSEHPISNRLDVADKKENTESLSQADRLHILRHAKNQGKGMALQSAMKWSVQRGFTHLITIDADGQHPISEIEKLTAMVYRKPWSLVIGDRDMNAQHVPASSQFGKKFSNFWVQLQTGKNVGDSQSGFRIYPLFLFQRMKFITGRYDFEIEAIVRFLWKGGDVQSVPIRVIYFPGAQRITHFHKFKDNFRLTILNTYLVARCFFERPKLFFINQSKNKSKKIAFISKDGLGILFMRWVLKNIGLKAAYFCLWFIVPYYFLFSIQARKSAMEYWQIIKPEIGFFHRQIMFFRQLYVFAQTLVDRSYSKTSEDSQFEFYWAPGFHISFDELNQNAKGILLMLCHAGGWELAMNSFSKKKYEKKMATVMFHQQGQFRHSSESGSHKKQTQIIYYNQQTGSIMQLKKNLLAGEVVGLMSDRPVGRSYELVTVFGYLCLLDSTAVRLQLQTQSQMAALFCAKVSDRQYEVRFADLNNLQFDEKLISIQQKFTEESIQKTLANYALSLENWLKLYPEQWFNFVPFWSETIL